MSSSSNPLFSSRRVGPWHRMCFRRMVELPSHHRTRFTSMTLNIEANENETKTLFRLILSWLPLNLALFLVSKKVFHENILIADHRYDRTQWWGTISNEPYSIKNNIISIQNQTLRFLVKWIGMVVHSLIDLRLCIATPMNCNASLPWLRNLTTPPS